jgi:sulfate adenylyltransferase subunit 1 (EFTu-like GTPase family)
MSQEPLVPGRELTLKCATQETPCSAVKITGRMDTSTLEMLEDTASELRMNEAGQVTFKTTRPVVVEDTSYVEDLGRFVIEKDNEMLGAGIIRKAASRRNRIL